MRMEVTFMNTETQAVSNHQKAFSDDGHIRVRNLSAYWILKITLKRRIHGTTYIVTGSYEGTECFTRKLERIMERKGLQNSDDPVENAEESHDRSAEI